MIIQENKWRKKSVDFNKDCIFLAQDLGSTEYSN